MKKILTLALLTAAVIVLTQGNAHAGKLFNKCHGCVTFCPAYYNAFSPPCLGVKGKHCCCVPFPGFPTQAPAPCCDAPVGDCCADGACHGQLPDAGLAPAPTQAAPMPTQALPAPISTPDTPTTSQSNYPPQGPTQASYYPNRAAAAYSGHSLSVYPAAAAGAYNYGAYPGYNYGQPVSVPSYWYGNR